jgi:hypothetical protein
MAQPDASQPRRDRTLIRRKKGAYSKFFLTRRAGAIVWRVPKP